MKELVTYRYNIMDVDSPAAFAGIRGGYRAGCRDVYFVRLLGSRPGLDEEICDLDRKMTVQMQQGRLFYNRILSLPRLSDTDDVAYYSGCYSRWDAGGRCSMQTKVSGVSEQLARQLSDACAKAFGEYRKDQGRDLETIQKNFYIKVLFWLDVVCSGLKQWDERSCIKIVADNVVNRQQYLFYYVLTLIGCDVLLIQSREDIEDAASDQLSKEVRIGNFTAGQIPKYQALAKEQTGRPDAQAGRPSIQPGGSDAQAGRPAIQPGRPDAQAGRTNIPAVQPGRPDTQAHGSQNNGADGKIVVKIPKRDRRRGTGASSGQNGLPQSQMPSDTQIYTPAGSRAPSAPMYTGVHPSAASNPSAGARPASSRPAAAHAAGVRPAVQPDQPVSRDRGGAAGALYTPDSSEKSFEELAQLASSIVMIAVHNKNGDVTSTGSGIMVGRNGYILTNDHVARGGCFYSIRIENDEKVYQTDELIKYHSDLDLALMRISRRLEPLPIYKGAKKLVRGQAVVAIGSPLGLFNSVSNGIISGFRILDGVHMIQFTAPISNGSSGGAVLNLNGEVIGISTAGFDQGQNINLAVGYESINMFVQGFQS